MIDDGKYTPPEKSRILDANEIGYAQGLSGNHSVETWILIEPLYHLAYENGRKRGTRERLCAARKVSK